MGRISPPISKLTLRYTRSLPADYLSEAQRIARRRKVNLSTVIGEALAEGLCLQTLAEQSDEVLDAYKRHFPGSRKRKCPFWTALFSNRVLVNSR